MKKQNEVLQQSLSDREHQIQTLNRTIAQLRKEVNSITMDRSLLHTYQSQITEMQQVYSASQKELQSLREFERSAKERENEFTLKLSECEHNYRLLEESNRSEKTRSCKLFLVLSFEVELEEEITRLQSLLQIERNSSSAVQLSLKKEKQVSSQLQKRVSSLQRNLNDLQQQVNVG